MISLEMMEAMLRLQSRLLRINEQANVDRQRRVLSDVELDSGDDLDRDDRMEPASRRSDSPEEELKSLNVIQTVLPRHPGPEPGDNEVGDHAVN
jgi:hypothetical protein